MVPELTDKALRRGSFNSVPNLITAIEDYLSAHNDDPKPFVWTATAESILAKLARASAITGGALAVDRVVICGDRPSRSSARLAILACPNEAPCLWFP